MPQGDKSAYTDKQKRKAEHIEDSYEERGVVVVPPPVPDPLPRTLLLAGAVAGGAYLALRRRPRA